MKGIAASLLYLLARALGLLPWRVLHALGDALGRHWRRSRSRESKVAMCSLGLAFPGMDPARRERLHQEVLGNTGRQLLESLRFWTRPAADSLALLDDGPGVEQFDAALAEGRGLIVLAPHHGNWELLSRWLAARTPLAILYAPPGSAVVDGFLRRVRGTHADCDRVEQVRADGGGVRRLLRRLQDGGVVGILPDQQPKRGDGVWAPFFGVPALTMTLVGRLAARTGARVVYAWCERQDGGPRFTLHVEDAPPGIADPDPVASATAMNAGIEAIVRRVPEQYQWTYKRWSQQPPDHPGGNPYWPECY